MECKSNLLFFNLFTVFELIDTLWNVNYNPLYAVKRAFKELIDTLWNVNLKQNKQNRCYSFELIDTLWNVNIKQFLYSFNLCWGINRYIMECKLAYHLCSQHEIC